ncbi:MAG: YaiI/YqxD family protein [Myxococcota bacterium]
MTVWVDADAAPRAVKEILFRLADARRVPVVLVANQPLRTPPSRFVRSVVVGRDFDAADDWLAEQVQAGDVVVTADVPLAARVVEKGGTCLDPRGEVLDATNIGSRLQVRDLMETLRESGELLGGPPPYHDRDKHKFAAALQKLVPRDPR